MTFDRPIGDCSYTSRFLNKSKSTAVVAPPVDDRDLSTAEDSDSRYGTNGLTNGNAANSAAAGGRSRYLALKERRTRLARSRSSHNLGNDDEDQDDPPLSPTTTSPSAYLASRCARQGVPLRFKPIK